MTIKIIHTERLRLISCNIPMLEALLQGNQSLADYLNINVPDVWTEFGDPVFRFCLDKLQTSPDEAIWWTYLPILKSENMLVGSCGYKGAPDKTGVVEIGYEVASAYRQQGIAYEIVQALIKHSFSNPEVKKVIAHTLAQENPSVRVLRKCNFIKTADINDPDDGRLWKWELDTLMSKK